MTDDGKVPCGFCETPFIPLTGWQKFCSDGCRQAHAVKRRKEAMTALKEKEDWERQNRE